MAGALGCGGGESDTTTSSAPAGGGSSSTSIDPCTLVTKAEADEALGGDAKQDRPTEANIPPRMVACRYVAPRGEGVVVLTVIVRTGESAGEAKTGFDSIRSTMPSETVSGLGDDAFWMMDQLYVLRGTRQLSITGDITKEKGMELARRALDRLK
jgi:hypothetical protein